jgi:diadenosine tetraphosphate (Ap4A) HIT family hydrolase
LNFTVVILCQIYSCLKEVPHVHFHVIPKPAATLEEGLSIGWPAKPVDKEELQMVLEEMKAKLDGGGSAL